MPAIVDAHQHFWTTDPATAPWYWPWLSTVPELLCRDFTPEDLIPELEAVGVAATVLVQSADSIDETRAALALAESCDRVAGVVGWVPLDDVRAAEVALDELQAHPKFCGVRHLIFDYEPDWLIREELVDGFRLLAERGVSFDIVSILPRHLEHVPVLADRAPGLRMVIDHLSKPPIEEKGWEPWASLLARAAEIPTVTAKLSGLGTAADWSSWTACDLQPYVNHALALFGPDRIMWGSDWPVSLQAGNYGRVWTETIQGLAGLDDAARQSVLGGTAIAWYGLNLESG